jgi:excisionase family DNA binding protein
VTKLLSIKESAEVLKLSRWTVTEMLESGQLPGVILRAGRRKRIWRIREADLEKWITQREQETKRMLHSTRPALAVVGGGQDG